LRAVADSSPGDATHEYVRPEVSIRRRSQSRWVWAAVAAVLAIACIGGLTLFVRPDRTEPTRATTTSTIGFVLDPLPEQGSPGSTMTVTGGGCPATSEHVIGNQPVLLVLTPPNGGNDFGPTRLGDEVDAGMNQMYVPGESEAQATPQADGTFSSVLPIPEDAPLGGPYTVRALCLTLVRVSDAPDGLDPVSVNDAQAVAGALTVTS
jgi:hypothetical protein